MDKHLCGCRRCPLYQTLARATTVREQWEGLFTDGAHRQDKWLEARTIEIAARAAWLDHVLAFQQRELVAQAA